MKFLPIGIDGAYLIEMEPHEDERGYFARTRSNEEFLAHGLDADLSECSISFNKRQRTLRGMHYQVPPHEETKLVTCVRGLIFDALVDLRKDSNTYLKSFCAELSLENGHSLYIPPGVAHGFLTLEDDTYVQYQIGGAHAPDAARGIRWNDPALDFTWPFEPELVSERDRNFADYTT